MHTPNWHTLAACRNDDTAKWFVDRGGNPEPARLVCAGCPVRVDCLLDAVARCEVHGMWGGAAGQTLRRLRREFTKRDYATHATPGVVDGCECAWCALVAAHEVALARVLNGETTRYILPLREDFSGREHGLPSTYNVGCRCDQCSLAKAFTPTTRRSA